MHPLRMSVPHANTSGVTIVNIVAYLLSCFCSIAFLVYLNATQSFVITVLLRMKDNIGDYVGTLGFIDELVSVIMCPLWGTLSDKIGTRTVCSVAYVLVGIGLVFFVQAKNVYPDLLLLRMCFAIGGSGTAAMVTALLSEVSSYRLPKRSFGTEADAEFAPEEPGTAQWFEQQQRQQQQAPHRRTAAPPVRNGTLSGLVGLCTGLGAVMAVTVLLPIPTRLEAQYDLSPEESLKSAFYIVGIVAIVVGAVLFVGLRQDPSRSLSLWIRSIRFNRRRKRLNQLRQQSSRRQSVDSQASTESNEGVLQNTAFDDDEWLSEHEHEFGQQYLEKKNSYFRLLLKGFTAASEPDIFLAYVGGLIARAASVAVSLFIPLFVNQYFYSEGICAITTDVKDSCRDAYIRSAMLTGVAETCALVAAPIWGIACDKIGKTKSLAITAVIGTIGFFGFASLDDPRVGISFLWATFIGIGQIGAIVCSLSLCTERRVEYSGSIAGVYSVTGAAGILILTKLGGWTSDRSRGAPFILMAVFNIILFICAVWVMSFEGGVAAVRLWGGDRLTSRERENLGQRISYTVDNVFEDGNESDDEHATAPSS
ncbi:major facilitator superfamily domain-containing protein [Lipomyces tetrasporus]|uniref:Major facilitator superfamily domain-containing protein n=1 Tax=Lipomyces tetrasporus TaxID=54092 RepID=A0AAD7VTM2_9ASCO|nr:major facilitator superfamily domain-containing protein [Lipomyces tetrasporus]KAJ8102247.1 major facilitator superfamily domain-containing protein [Lipomyces tetrasporus]